jgi:gamma-glutamyltranspeptidase/glutathione hydrolase
MLTATAATIVEKDGRPWFSLGTPGGLRIFPTVLQGIINVLDHGMTLQESVEAPRVWTAGQAVEVEAEVPEGVVRQLQDRGHQVSLTSRIAGGMNGVQIDLETGLLMGAACWRADGSPAGLSGAPALEGKAEGSTPYPMKS